MDNYHIIFQHDVGLYFLNFLTFEQFKSYFLISKKASLLFKESIYGKILSRWKAGKSPEILHFICEGGYLDLFQSYVRDLPDPHFKKSIILSAIGKGHLPIITYLISIDATVIDFDNPIGDKIANISIKDFLIRYCPDPMGKNDSPIVCAVASGQIEMISYFISLGADISLHNNYVFLCALKNGHVEMVDYLVKRGADIHVGNDIAIGIAARNGDLEMVKYLISLGANVRANDNYAVRMACAYNYSRVTVYLVSQGADIRADHNFAIQWASCYDNRDFISYLIANGADFRDNDDKAVRLAAQHGNLTTVSYLVSLGADIRAADDDALKKAVIYGHLEMTKYLVFLGADIQSENNYALRMAAKYGHYKIFKYLVTIGADLSVLQQYEIDTTHPKILKYLKMEGIEARQDIGIFPQFIRSFLYLSSVDYLEYIRSKLAKYVLKFLYR